MIDLTPIFQAIIALLAALVTYKLIPWIKSRTTETQQKNLAAMARVAVFAAEQLYGAGNGDKKLEYARMILLNAGYNVDTDILRAAIESAVGDLFPHLALFDYTETDKDKAGAEENEAGADDAFAPETPAAESGERAPETDADENGEREPETEADESGESGDAPGVIEPPPDENA